MDKTALIDRLNEDLAGELAAITQYITYAAKATGPYRPQLASFFLGEGRAPGLITRFPPQTES